MTKYIQSRILHRPCYFYCLTSSGGAVSSIFKIFVVTRPGIEPRLTDFEANALINKRREKLLATDFSVLFRLCDACKSRLL